MAKYSAKDASLSRVPNWVWKGWPSYALSSEFTPFVSRQHELSAYKRCLLWSDCVVILLKLRCWVLEALHVEHPGIVRVKELAYSYVW